MIYKNYRSDFNVRVAFSRITDGVAVAVPVPDHVKIEFKTHERYRPFIVERREGALSMCSLSDDGMTLTAHLSLSRHKIGKGQLLADIIVITPDPDFPQQSKQGVLPVEFGAILYSGKSGDEDISVDAWAGDDSDIAGLNRTIEDFARRLDELQRSTAVAEHTHPTSEVEGLDGIIADFRSSLSALQSGKLDKSEIVYLTTPEVEDMWGESQDGDGTGGSSGVCGCEPMSADEVDRIFDSI